MEQWVNLELDNVSDVWLPLGQIAIYNKKYNLRHALKCLKEICGLKWTLNGAIHETFFKGLGEANIIPLTVYCSTILVKTGYFPHLEWLMIFWAREPLVSLYRCLIGNVNEK